MDFFRSQRAGMRRPCEAEEVPAKLERDQCSMDLPFTLSLDRTGFPILEMPALPFGVLWLPVTKIQFEHFLVDTGAFDNAWYQDKLNNWNPRISAGNLGVTNYWQAFMTGILPSEAIRYAEWVGQGADLPTAKEWKQA